MITKYGLCMRRMVSSNYYRLDIKITIFTTKKKNKIANSQPHQNHHRQKHKPNTCRVASLVCDDYTNPNDMTFIREEALLDYHNKDAIKICILLRELVDNLMNRGAEDGENDAR